MKELKPINVYQVTECASGEMRAYYFLTKEHAEAYDSQKYEDTISNIVEIQTYKESKQHLKAKLGSRNIELQAWVGKSVDETKEFLLSKKKKYCLCDIEFLPDEYNPDLICIYAQDNLVTEIDYWGGF